MSKVILHKTKRDRRKLRVRKKVFGTTDRPRLTVFRSNKYTTAQIIDDTKHHTVASISQNEVKKLHKNINKVEAAKKVGLALAEIAVKNGISSVVFDRNGYKYHGRVKELAKGAREGGLNL